VPATLCRSTGSMQDEAALRMRGGECGGRVGSWGVRCVELRRGGGRHTRVLVGVGGVCCNYGWVWSSSSVASAPVSYRVRGRALRERGVRPCDRRRAGEAFDGGEWEGEGVGGQASLTGSSGVLEDLRCGGECGRVGGVQE